MAYTPTEWKNGDVITAEKLNKLEEGVQEANGEKFVTVFDGSITTASSGNLAMGSFIPTTSIEGDSVLVTFENVTYELPKVVLSFGTGYGEFDNSNNPILTNYPCAIGISSGTYYFFTLEANTYEVEIKILQNSQNSPNSSIFMVTFSGDGNNVVVDKTFEEIKQAYLSGLLIVFRRLITSDYGSTFDNYYYGIANAYLTNGSPNRFYSNIIGDINFGNTKIESIVYRELEIDQNGPIITEKIQNF